MIYLSNLVKGISCVVGGFLLHFSLGTFYTFGNISPYVTSYLRNRTNDTWVTSGHLVWVFAFAALFLGLTMSIGGMMEKKLGARITCLIGAWSMSLGTIFTYFAVKQNIWWVMITYGVIFGGGSGIVYSVAIAAAMKWFPLKKGMIAGIVAAGYGLGSLIFNLVQTKFINPLNLSPNTTSNGEKYFTEAKVLDNVPFCFIIIGTVYAIIQLIGVILLTDSGCRRPSRESQLKNRLSENADNGASMKILFEDNCKEDSSKDICKEDSSKEDQEKMTQEESVNIRYENNHHTKIVPASSTDYSVKEAVKDRRLWILCLTFFLNGIVIIFISSLYKSFGQTFISNDRYFAVVGAIAAIFNSGGRVIWGRLLDIFAYRRMMTILTISMCVMMGTFYFCSLVTSVVGVQVMYFIWVCLLFFCLSGSFAMFPTITSQSFGNTNMAIIYGIVFLGFAMSGIIGALICSILLKLINYGGLFVVATVTSMLSLILTQFFRPKATKNIPLKDI